MGSFYRILQYLKTVEGMLASILLCFFMPVTKNKKYPPGDGHLTYYIIVYYMLCIFSWIAIINVWVIQREITLWAERLFSSIAAFCYILSSIVCMLPMNDESEHRCDLAADYHDRSINSLVALFTGMLFLMHAIMTTEMAPDEDLLTGEILFD